MYTIDNESTFPYVMETSPENHPDDDASSHNNVPNGGTSSPSIEFAQSRPNGLSTISGVFAPVALSMFSILLFMRMGFVVGQLGFLMTVVQLLMAYGIVMLTVLSLCAISSNGAVESGGVYYMISRSLGPEFGGAIGVLFFVANVFSCALYISGFTEALLNNLGGGQFPDSPMWRFLYCVLVSIILLIIGLLGAGIFAKTALFTFILISICYSTWLISVIFDGAMQVPIPKVNTPAYRVHENASDPGSPMIVQLNQTLTANYTGFSFRTLGENMFTNYTMDYTTERQTDFALMFAIIFSGVTGLMAGANMSGELARPSVSIPRGTVQAVLVTLLIYIMTAFLMAATSSRYLLQNDYTVMMDTNFQRWFILIGIFSTTLFSSMSNLIGSSRVLNRLSHDKLFGCLLRPAKIEIGDRNPVAYIQIFCLVDVRSWRDLHHNDDVGSRCVDERDWYCGPNVTHYGAALPSANSIVRFNFTSVDLPPSPKIPPSIRCPKRACQILLLVSRPSSSCPLMDFVNDLKKSGLYVIGHVRKGELDSTQAVDPLQQVFPYWLSLVDYLKLKAFVELTLSNSIREGIQQLMRLSGLGAMKPNTVVLGFHEATPIDVTLQESQLLKDLRYSKIDRAAVVEYFTAGDFMPKELNGNMERLSSSEYVNVLKDVLHMTKSLCVARHFHKMDKESLSQNWNQKRYIDVWPVDLQRPVETGLGWDNSSLFLLQLACILSMSSRWRSHARLRVFICVNSLQDMHRRDRQLKQMLDTLRIKAESIVVPWDHVVCHFPQQNGPAITTQRPTVELPASYLTAFNDMIKRYSEEAAITLLNLPLPPDDVIPNADRYLDQIRRLTDSLPPTLMVHGVSSVISTAL
ncbi:amino acid permease [Ostertagia ostertagi]